MRFKMDNGVVVDTDNAQKSWDEETRWDGNNFISIPTGSQWNHQTLYKSRKGRYYIVHESQWQGSTPSANWVSDKKAARWLAQNNHELPDDLAALVAEILD